MKQHEAWLFKADHDLISARKLMEGGDPMLDTAVFHAQQCAEKALKGYLSFKHEPIHKTHNLVVLVENCCRIDESFRKLFPDAEEIAPYGTAFRYPDIALEPDRADVLEAISKAEAIFEFVKGKIAHDL